jgi:hypothetical protein
MTQDEIYEMARQVGFPIRHPEWQKAVEEFAALVEEKATAKEREACALICERIYKRMCPEAQENEVGIEAEIIRARGEA